MVKRPTSTTLDLFRDFEPKPVVDRFLPADVQAWSPAGRVSKAVALTLNDSTMSRAEIAKAMSELLKDEVSKTMLDAYASQARENSISAIRLAALSAVTGDIRPLNALLADMDMIVVPQKYEALLRREKAREMRDRAEREEQAADAEWRARR